ncbi:MAG: phosphoenolpyruvate mutase [Gammaproteobacteria bacterium]|nr:phosphoenolpyruvate mutase [Pseudomonadota bacterium]TDJ18107.1 MAG: phosphoenolpyruvate mutase [Gammaproteobacteria bacterium]
MSKDTLSTKSGKLRALLESNQLEFIMEAHNGISAQIVEQAGFKGIWGSGLAMSAQFGVRDSNEVSWTQVVDILEFMSDATEIPILLDGDTGYGNFNNMRRLVKKLEQREIAGVCIEDKLFPKTNSFIDGERQPLADVDEFCGKIKAGKDSQHNPDFCIVARVEALIAGWGIREALERAEAYHRAGADGILIHSKLSQANEVLEFAHEWGNRSPLVIVPTTYYSTPTDIFRNANISLVIWANHMVRAAVASMEKISADIYANESVIDVEDNIAPVKKLFSLQGAAELSEAQERYLRPKGSETRAIVLAASRGYALGELTEDKPKVMLSIGGKTVLRHLLDEFKNQNINRVTLVAGYKPDAIDTSGLDLHINKDYATTGELVSLVEVVNEFHDDMIITYGDLLFRSYILRDLLENDGEIVAVIDSTVENENYSGSPDYAYCSQIEDRTIFKQDVFLNHVSEGKESSPEAPSGRWIGMLRVRGQGRQWIEEAIDDLKTQENYKQMSLADLLNQVIQLNHPVKVHYINGHWIDINALVDIDRAGDFTKL